MGARGTNANGESSTRPLYTVGHSTRTAEELIAVLRAWGVTRLVDIRTLPRSRTNPWFNADTLPATLAPAGIAYARIAALGGLRGKSKSAEPSKNAGWEHRGFRNYADHAETETFRTALSELLALASHETCAVMCAEAVWWRCHRRIVADHAIARGVPVVHIFTAEKAEPASMTPFAQVEPGDRVRYPAP